MTENPDTDVPPGDWLIPELRRMGLAGADEAPPIVPLTGGVSSDIFRVDLAGGPVCVKRALAKLKVAADWQAPVERNAYEYAWMLAAAAIEPDSVPEILGHDVDSGLFVMRFLDPADYLLWKAELRAGRADPAIAASVGARLVRIHAATAGDAGIAVAFATDRIFHPIRLEPYLLATARVHADLAGVLEELAETTIRTKKALVHGDVSPKNILIGPRGPVFLDAECAWYGDPAFDLAFCLNHLLLKCLWTPSAAAGFLDCFDTLAAAYLEKVDWEPAAELEGRVARLLPGLFLARVDGKSPVEYLTDEGDKDRVRRAARAWLTGAPDRLAAIREDWTKETLT